MGSRYTELSSAHEGLVAQLEEVKGKELFDSSSELEEALKQVELLQDQLDEGQKAAEK